MPYQDSLAAMIHEPTFKAALPPGLWNQVRMVHKLGNLAVHSETRINQTDGPRRPAASTGCWGGW